MKEREFIIIENICADNITLFARLNGHEQQVTIPPGKSMSVDNHETRTIKLFRKRGFITTSNSEIELEADLKTIDSSGVNTDDKTTEVSETEPETGPENKIEKAKPEESVSVSPEGREPHLSDIEIEVEQYIEDGFVKGVWSDKEVEFLTKEYPKNGRRYCASKLNRNEISVQKKVTSLGLKKKKKK